MAAVKVPAAPRTLGAAGRELWADVLGVYELGPHERALLLQAAHTLDSITELQREVSKLGVMERTGFETSGVRAALREARQQQLTYLKLLGQLNLPADAGEEAKPVKNTRHRPRTRLSAVEGL